MGKIYIQHQTPAIFSTMAPIPGFSKLQADFTWRKMKSPRALLACVAAGVNLLNRNRREISIANMQGIHSAQSDTSQQLHTRKQHFSWKLTCTAGFFFSGYTADQWWRDMIRFLTCLFVKEMCVNTVELGPERKRHQKNHLKKNSPWRHIIF